MTIVGRRLTILHFEEWGTDWMSRGLPSFDPKRSHSGGASMSSDFYRPMTIKSHLLTDLLAVAIAPQMPDCLFLIDPMAHA